MNLYTLGFVIGRIELLYISIKVKYVQYIYINSEIEYSSIYFI